MTDENKIRKMVKATRYIFRGEWLTDFLNNQSINAKLLTMEFDKTKVNWISLPKSKAGLNILRSRIRQEEHIRNNYKEQNGLY
jgi:hypothetical protein